MNQEDQRKLIEAMISEIYLHPNETLIEVETASQAHGQKQKCSHSVQKINRAQLWRH